MTTTRWRRAWSAGSRPRDRTPEPPTSHSGGCGHLPTCVVTCAFSPAGLTVGVIVWAFVMVSCPLNVRRSPRRRGGGLRLPEDVGVDVF